MPHSLPILKKTITLQEALDEDEDILHELSYPEKQLDFFYYTLGTNSKAASKIGPRSLVAALSFTLCGVQGAFLRQAPCCQFSNDKPLETANPPLRPVHCHIRLILFSAFTPPKRHFNLDIMGTSFAQRIGLQIPIWSPLYSSKEDASPKPTRYGKPIISL